MSGIDPGGLVADTLIDRDTLQARIAELGAQITLDYADDPPLLVCVLKGAFMFLADLVRSIDLPVEVDFMAISSYGSGTQTSGIVRIVKDLEISIEGRAVIMVFLDSKGKQSRTADAGRMRKWLEAIKQIAPGVTRVVALLQVETAANAGFLRAAQSAASSLGVTLTGTSVHNASEIETALMALSAEVNCGLIVMPHPVTTANRELILKMAAQYRLPAVYPFRYYTAAGGLMSYGIDLVDLFRRAATYVDRILRGVKPRELPVQAPSKFEMVINLKTAKALGLDVPLHLQQLADEVIE